MKPSSILKKKHNFKDSKEPNFEANYRVLLSNETEDSPFLPDKSFLGIARMFWHKSNSIEDFLNGLNGFVMQNIVYQMSNPKEKHYYVRNAKEVYAEKQGICSERAFFMISLARIAGIDADFGVPVPHSKYEHGLILASSESGIIAIEPCGKSKYHNLGYVAISEENLKQRFKEWRKGDFSYSLGR